MLQIMKSDEFYEELKHRKNLIDVYFRNYYKFVNLHENSKASEMLWGIINNIVWLWGRLELKESIKKHGKVIQAIDQMLLGKVDKKSGRRYIADANQIHKNFFHDNLDESDFDTVRESVEELITKLAEILREKVIEEGYHW